MDALADHHIQITILCVGLAKPRGREVAAEVAAPIQSQSNIHPIFAMILRSLEFDFDGRVGFYR
jgi:hypothetical protein